MNMIDKRDLPIHISVLGWLYLFGNTFFLVLAGIGFFLLQTLGAISRNADATTVLSVLGAIFALLMIVIALPGLVAGYGLLKRKQWPGEVVRAFNTTRMLDRIAARHGRKLNECSIGFKYIADLMMEREIAIGGEESGGIGYSRYLPERDGILNSLLLANVMAEEQKPLGELVARLQKEYGPHYYGRRDLHISDEIKLGAITRAKADGTRKLGKYAVVKKEGLDGVKFFLDASTNGNGAEPWVLFRASGTEPLLRIYAEAASPELVEEILSLSEAFVHSS